MLLQKTKDGHLEIKSKKASIEFNDKITVNEVELEGAGEYEIGEVAIEGIDDNSYVFQIEDIVLGSVNFKTKITKENIEKLSNADVILLRLDGKASEAVEAAGQIGSSVVVYFGNAHAESALKSAGATFEKIENLKITKADITEEKSYFIEVANGTSDL
jgi:hypothetical protein